MRWRSIWTGANWIGFLPDARLESIKTLLKRTVSS
jgi:hypothetical protein